LNSLTQFIEDLLEEEMFPLPDPNYQINRVESQLENEDFFRIIALKLHNRDAQYHLYDKIFPQLQKFIINNSGDYEDTRDITQETVIELYKKLKTENYFSVKNLIAYAIGIGKKLWLKELQKRKRKFQFDNEYEERPEENIEIEDKSMKDCESVILHDSLNSLDENQRKFIIYYDLEGHNIKDTALNFNMDEKSVRVKAVRCRKYLRTKMLAHPDYKECFEL